MREDADRKDKAKKEVYSQMPAWWDSLETMSMISSRARAIAWALGILVAICGTVVFFVGRRVDALKAEQSGPRHLSAKNRAQLIELLKANHKGTLTVWYESNDSEVSGFTAELADAIQSAGWTVNVIHEGAVVGAGKGIHIEVKEKITPGADALQGALEKVGFPADGIINTHMSDTIRLTVGSKP